LREVARYVTARGGRTLEGYPTQPKGGRTGDAFVFTGIPSAFADAGFHEVARRSPSRPIMRRELRPAPRAARRPAVARTRRAGRSRG